MKPAPFDYHRPGSIEAALSLLSAHGNEAALLAGGQSLVPMMNMRLARPAHLIDVNRLAGLDRVTLSGDSLEIGALMRHQDLATNPLVRGHCPILAHAASTIGHYVIRQRGTLGGSLSIADPSAQLPVIAALLDARILLRSQNSARTVRARDFFVGAMTTEKADDEMITLVAVPALGDGETWGFELFAPRAGDYAIVIAAAILRRGRKGAILSARLALGGVAGAPVVLSDTLAAHVGKTPGAKWPAAIADEVAGLVEPEAGGRYDRDYKRQLARVLSERAFAAALAAGTGGPA